MGWRKGLPEPRRPYTVVPLAVGPVAQVAHRPRRKLPHTRPSEVLCKNSFLLKSELIWGPEDFTYGISHSLIYSEKWAAALSSWTSLSSPAQSLAGSRVGGRASRGPRAAWAAGNRVDGSSWNDSRVTENT